MVAAATGAAMAWNLGEGMGRNAIEMEKIRMEREFRARVRVLEAEWGLGGRWRSLG